MLNIPQPVDPKNPKRVRKELTLAKETRLEQRKQLAETWLQEEENSRYRYDVERCRDGKRIYLLSPTWLNKGFDFQINLEGFPSKSNEAPKHGDILGDLAAKKAESQDDYKHLRELIDEVYGCREPDEVIKRFPSLTFKKGFPTDTLLKIIKWMFIEQDLTYWNNTGRRMFMGAIRKLD